MPKRYDIGYLIFMQYYIIIFVFLDEEQATLLVCIHAWNISKPVFLKNGIQLNVFFPQGQKCLRKCSSDEDCKSKKKKCLCDGACGMSCIKPGKFLLSLYQLISQNILSFTERECPELPNPTLGTVTLTGRNFSSRAIYTCPHGYHVVGLHSRLCQAYGHWSGTEPACKQNSS